MQPKPLIAFILLALRTAATFAGDIQADGQLISQASDGTAPLVVSSTTEVANLNAQYLQGQQAASFALASETYSMTEIDALFLLLEQSVSRSVRPFYYLTPNKHAASQVRVVCDAGFHFASIFELADPSYLVYDTNRGLNTDDNGLGPPLSSPTPPFTRYGWVRTGGLSSNMLNCNDWSSDSEEDRGAAAGLRFDRDEFTPGWHVVTGLHGPDCSTLLRVWCVSTPDLSY